MPHEEISIYAYMHLVGTTYSGAIAEENFLIRQEDLSLSRRNIYHRLDFCQRKQDLRN